MYYKEKNNAPNVKQPHSEQQSKLHHQYRINNKQDATFDAMLEWQKAHGYPLANDHRHGKPIISRSQTAGEQTVCQPASSVAVFIMMNHKFEDPLITKTRRSRGLTFIGGSRWWHDVTTSYERQ